MCFNKKRHFDFLNEMIKKTLFKVKSATWN